MASEKPYVFLDIAIGGTRKGKIQIRLFDEAAPMTAENFRKLCTGRNSAGEKGKPLHFRGSLFDRVIPEFVCRGGNGIRSSNGLGRTIYGPMFPVVERTESNIKFDVEGRLCTAHTLPDDDAPYACGSAFLITTKATPWLDGMHTIFGQVMRGMEVVKAIDKVGTRSGTPTEVVRIIDCGEEPSASVWGAPPRLP